MVGAAKCGADRGQFMGRVKDSATGEPMNWRTLFAHPPAYNEEDVDLDEPTFLRAWERRQYVGELRFRPLLWSDTPPNSPGNYYCKRPGETEYILVQVRPGDEYRMGNMLWAGPLPTPYEPQRPGA